jgi:hypothetical protein
MLLKIMAIKFLKSCKNIILITIIIGILIKAVKV